MKRAMLFGALLCLAALPLAAQDPVKVDPKHYKVELENAQVRVLRIHYGPHEKSVMHSHPNLVVIPLADSRVRFTTPDGKVQERELKANASAWEAAEIHNPENLTDKPIDAILVELKGRAAAPAKTPPPPPKKKSTM